MNIILTNDDGIDAPGLENLTKIVSSITAPIVVAPHVAQSGVGHRVTARFPITVERRSDNRYRVMGTPADGARLAIKQCAPNAAWRVSKAPAAHCYWNVNLPHPLHHDVKPPVVFCELDTHPHKYTYHRQGDAYHYRGTIHERPRQPGRDVAVCFGGSVAFTQLAI